MKRETDMRHVMEIARRYIAIARPDHWIKNIFMIPGTALAFMVGNNAPDYFIPKALLGFAVVCLLSSANYTLNEYLDAETDRLHPVKKDRFGALGLLDKRFVAAQYSVLCGAGLLLACFFGAAFFATAAVFVVMGILYNLPPVRVKDRAYLDVIFESANSPLRLLFGWFLVVQIFPPSSALLAYWMGGAFLMAMKRYSEYRFIADEARAAMYRRSFARYGEETLLLSSFFYALNSAFFLGVFLIKYRVEYCITLPFIALLFVWYMAIALRKDSAAQAPEKLYKERGFLIYVAFLWVLLTAMAFIDIPVLHLLIPPTQY